MSVDKTLKEKEISYLISFLFESFIFNSKSQAEFIHALSLVKIISSHYNNSISIYLELLSDYLKNPNSDRFDNKIKQLICEIYGNVLDKNDCKNKFINSLQNILLVIILNRPSNVMMSALE
jgi:hypothetical protein